MPRRASRVSAHRESEPGPKKPSIAGRLGESRSAAVFLFSRPAIEGLLPGLGRSLCPGPPSGPSLPAPTGTRPIRLTCGLRAALAASATPPPTPTALLGVRAGPVGGRLGGVRPFATPPRLLPHTARGRRKLASQPRLPPRLLEAFTGAFQLLLGQAHLLAGHVGPQFGGGEGLGRRFFGSFAHVRLPFAS